MDARFIGVRVQVTFKSSTAQTVQGAISAVAPGVSLTLKNVTIVNRPGTVLPSLVIHLEHVNGVVVIEDTNSAPPTQPPSATASTTGSKIPPPVSTVPNVTTNPPVSQPKIAQPIMASKPVVNQPMPVSAPIPSTKPMMTREPSPRAIGTQPPDPKTLPTPKTKLAGFNDPAIMSMGRVASAPRSGNISDAAARSGGEASHHASASSISGPPVIQQKLASGPVPVITATATSTGIVDVVTLEAGFGDMAIESGKIKSTRTKIGGIRENRISRNRKHRDQQKQHYSSTSGRGKGWRNTPLLEDIESFQPFNALKKKSQLPDTWGQNDFVDGDDFDFEEGLARFNKHQVFEGIRLNDTIREDERLVYHNLKAKPGTAGGKNLHHTENVLDSTPKVSSKVSRTNDDFWNSEADVHIEDRRTSKSARKPEGRPGLVRQQSIRMGSGSSTGMASGRVNSQLKEPVAGFYLEPSNRYIDAVSPLQMVTLENTAVNELGLPEAVLMENAARGIAAISMELLDDPAVRHGLGVVGAQHPRTELIKKTVMLVLAGNNKSGARAIASARLLRSKGMDVRLCVVDIDRESLLIDAVKLQVRLYRNYGGRVYDKQELFDLYRSSKESGSPIKSTLILDGLLGLTVPFDELRTAEQATVYELIHWVDKDPGFVISLDVPSGIDPVSGRIAIVDGVPLHVKPRYIVAIGAPKKGLMEAIYPGGVNGNGGAGSGSGEDGGDGVHEAQEWELWVVDVGFDGAVWKKAGVKARHAVDFGGRWICRMKFRGLGGDEDD